MKSDEDFAFGCFLIGFFLATVLILFIVFGLCDLQFNKEDVVRHGGGVWQTQQDGSVEFKWKDELEDKK